MAIVELSADQEMSRLWGIIAELGEQLSRNRALSVQLYTQAGQVKVQAIHAQTGFVLRRFNAEKSQEAYDSELERMTASISAENQGLLHDNKQLNALIKEYEQTLDNLMSAFRNRAREVQEHELSLIREYETKLLEREDADATRELTSSSSLSQSLAQISHLLRLYMRSLNGEDVERPEGPALGDDEHEWTNVAASDWALERECELARLERENEVLRRLVGQAPLEAPPPDQNPPPLARTLSGVTIHHGKELRGGPTGRVGPFGTYKAMARSAG
ncbi:hypothetical protein PLICRDRAFT_113936 [Plicaturopsis crispa FD-325 SS-3]|nr:hypothetical protein PLICRDRAFT_113936 [Plicaturopsis crispa FD-325 SS-3]